MEVKKIKKFDTKVQHLEYKILKEVANCAYEDKLLEKMNDIPKIIIPGKTPTMRCCVYKERAIVGERVKLAVGGDSLNHNVIEVIDIACDDCPAGGYEVTNACRGCLAHRCEDACRFGAITFDRFQKAHIDKSKCVECGACAKECPYSAIIVQKRPCENSCKVNAISMSEDKHAVINPDKCTACGSCVYQCPFGAIVDKSFILNVIDMVKKSNNNKNYKMYAIVAPSIASQFVYAKTEQVVTGIKKLGFYSVVETALGADLIALEESKEWKEKGFLTSSCCPAFVTFVKNEFPDMAKFISSNVSPMMAIAKYIKKNEPNSKVVFIGPCTAKKREAQLPEVSPYVDSVITFAELQALFDSNNIDITNLELTTLDNASFYGRIFARSGGLSEAVKEALIEQGLDASEFKPVICDGIEQCKIALLKARKNMLEGNFIEGMACVDGCIGGAGCLTHGKKNKAEVDKYGRKALEKNIIDATKVLK
ncbi:MAG: 4Fe-4S dicluster domain-containing protein [Clostridia bacterium]